VAASDDGSGNGYTVDVTVTDGAGNTASDATSVSETASTNGAPVVDAYTVTEAGSPNPHAEITADWSVSDGDGNLESVLVEAVDADTGTVADASNTTVSGSSASGSDSFKIKGRGETYDVVLTVTDGAGATDSATRTVSE
jgi:subtilisin